MAGNNGSDCGCPQITDPCIKLENPCNQLARMIMNYESRLTEATVVQHKIGAEDTRLELISLGELHKNMHRYAALCPSLASRIPPLPQRQVFCFNYGDHACGTPKQGCHDQIVASDCGC